MNNKKQKKLWIEIEYNKKNHVRYRSAKSLSTYKTFNQLRIGTTICLLSPLTKHQKYAFTKSEIIIRGWYDRTCRKCIVKKYNSLSVRYNRRLSLLLNTLLIFLKTLWIRNCKVAFNSWIQKYVFQYYFKNCRVESIQCTDSFLDQKRSLIIILPPKFHRYVHFNNDTQEFVRGPVGE